MPALQVRMSEDEYSRCREEAGRVGKSMSEWVRGRLFDREGYPPKVGVPRTPTVGADGVIAAPAREVPLPPVKRRRNMSAEDARAVQEFAERSYPAVVPDDAALNALPPEVDFDPPAADAVTIVVRQDGLESLPAVRLEDLATESTLLGGMESPAPPDLHLPDDAPVALSGPDVVSAGGDGPMVAAFSKPRKFTRSPKCTSDKCERLQAPTCDACRWTSAEVSWIEMCQEAADPPCVAVKAWASGQRSPACITAKCGQLGAACCEPCRKFNARGFRELEF